MPTPGSGWLGSRSIEACRAQAGESINTLSCEHSALAALGDFAAARRPAVALMAVTGAGPGAVETVRTLPPRAAYAAFLRWRAEHFLPDGASWFQQAQVMADAGLVQSSLDRLERSIRARFGCTSGAGLINMSTRARRYGLSSSYPGG